MQVKGVTNDKLNDKGFSLVELIIAIAIGAIVSGSIAALMSFAVRNYRDQSVNTQMQYELQTNINQVMNEIMGSTGMVIVQNHNGTGTAPLTKYAVFGNFNADIEDSGSGSTVKGFKGVIFASGGLDSSTGKFNIYMNRVEKKYSGSTPKACDVAKDCFNEIEGTFSSSGPNPYLLGENASVFSITPDPDNSCLDNTNLNMKIPYRWAWNFSLKRTQREKLLPGMLKIIPT